MQSKMPRPKEPLSGLLLRHFKPCLPLYSRNPEYFSLPLSNIVSSRSLDKIRPQAQLAIMHLPLHPLHPPSFALLLFQLAHSEWIPGKMATVDADSAVAIAAEFFACE
jgi:hypothetical protein